MPPAPSGGCGLSQPSYVMPSLPQIAPLPSALPSLTLGTAPAYVIPQQSIDTSPPQPSPQSYALPYAAEAPSVPPPPPPPPPPDSNYGYNDNLETSNSITGIDSVADKVAKPIPTSPSNTLEEKGPDLEDYADSSNRSEKDSKKNDLLSADYSDSSFAKTKGVPSDLTSPTSETDSTDDPKCSSETLRVIMHENIVSSPTISKQLIFSAGRLAFGQTIDVICSRNRFSYTVVSSKVFCEASRGRITCFAFLQP